MKRWLVIICCVLVWHLAAAQEIILTVALDSTDTGSGSPGKGTATLILSSDRTTVRYHIVVNRLSGPVTAAHIHLLPSTNAVHPIVFSGNEAAGTWMMPDSIFDDLFSERVYINVHTSAFPAGEIRGMPRPGQFGFSVALNGGQAGTASTGGGAGYVVVNKGAGTTSIRYRFTYAGLKGTFTAAHFHALPGGGVVHPVTFVDSTADGEWTSPPDSVWWKLMRGEIYLNVHTTFASGGEIRGSLQTVGEAPFIGRLDGAQAGTASSGQGTVWTVLRPDRSLRYTATYNRLQGSYTASHFHETRTGGVVQGIMFTNNHVSGTWSSLGDQTIADLFQGRLYLNVHSSTNAGGEIRGNLQYYDGVVTGELTGAAAGTPSTAKGTIWGRFREDSLEYSVTMAGLSSAFTGSHFHLSPAGTLIAPAPMSDSTASGYWGYGDRFYDLLRGDVYFNVHSSTYPGGELRANLAIGSGIATSVRSEDDATPQRFGLSQNYPNPFNPLTTIDLTTKGSDRVTLEVYNILGQKVAVLMDGVVGDGIHRVRFDASHLPSGIYLARLTGERSAPLVRRMLLLK
jgi:hypothetical protein